jgi:hypothetical protein
MRLSNQCTESENRAMTDSGAPQQYRKKPIVMEAMQWDGTPLGADPIINWVLTGDHSATWTEAHEGYSGDDGSYPEPA